jgi:hypothetical protein
MAMSPGSMSHWSSGYPAARTMSPRLSRGSRRSGTLFPWPCAAFAGILLGMDPSGPAFRHLSRAECLRLMAAVTIGRIVYTRHALPAVELVSFALDHGDIIVRTDADGKLAAATRGTVVAFEADDVDIARRSGWSVTVVGQSQEVTDPGERAQLERLGLSSWTPEAREHFIRITPGIVEGRQLHAPGVTGASGARTGSL